MRRLVALLVVAALLVPLLPLARSQPEYWVALNYEVEFCSDGTALVTAKFHPFTLQGQSLFGNKTVEKDIYSGEKRTIYEILLMFSENPSRVKYSVVGKFHANPNAVVYCDVFNTGKMDKLRGAYELTVKVYLNTSDFVEARDGYVVVKVRDSYTSQDPRSWIDVLEVRIGPSVKLLSYSWEPSFAHGPSVKENDTLIWFNFNEQEAPDYYVFKLKIPGFRIAKVVPLKAELASAAASGSEVVVTVRGVKGSGYATVRLVGTGTDQARRVYVEEGGEVTTSFPLVCSPQGLKVELWVNGVKVAEQPLGSKPVTVEAVPVPLREVAVAVAAAGALAIAVGVAVGGKRRERGRAKAPAL